MNNKIILLYKPVLSLSRIIFRSRVRAQKINVIPQKTFSEQILIDIRKIESEWRRSKDTTILNNHLYQCYIRSSESVTYAVDMILCACSRSVSSCNLVFDMLNSFSNYINDNNILFTPTQDQKIDVLTAVLIFKNYQLIQMVCRVFKIQDQPVLCKKFIEDLIEQQKLIEAGYIVSALHLQNEFDLKKILLPLLLEGYAHPATILMNDYPELQLETAKFLDGYLSTTKFASVDPYFKPRRVIKTLSSLINVFKIPLDHCPNMQFLRSKGAISVLVKRRAEQSVSEATWEEMINNIIGDNEDLKRFLVQKLVWRKDIKTAMKMAEKYNVKDDDLCLTELSNGMNENSVALDDDQPEDFELPCDSQENFDDDNYLKFTLKTEDIKVIDNKEDFINCINEISQNYRMIGIDSEWKPRFGLSRDRLSLIQLAVHDKVFIFDVLSLSECLETEHWDKLLDDIFGNSNLIKLGCGIMSDVHMILEGIKGTKGKAVKFSHILDMALFFQKLQEVYPVEMQIDKEKIFTRGLSSLCDIILDRPLSKEERLCDWEKRPLTEKQLQYAALDAHCLLLMYDKLKEEAVGKNMNFEHLSKVAIVVTTSQWKPKKKFKGIRSGKEFQAQKSIPVEQLKVVMDSAFEDQGKELRRLGADVVILQNGNSVDVAVEISEKEGRFIICSETLYGQVKSRVKDGFCYCFQSDGAEVKVSHFLQRFNSHASMKSILSRCITCNSRDGMKLSAEDLKILHQLPKVNSSINSAVKDNLTSFSSELQKILGDILNSDKDIKLSESNSSSISEFAFLCKNCGSIS